MLSKAELTRSKHWYCDRVNMFLWQVCEIPSLTVRVLLTQHFTGQTEPRP